MINTTLLAWPYNLSSPLVESRLMLKTGSGNSISSIISILCYMAWWKSWISSSSQCFLIVESKVFDGLPYCIVLRVLLLHKGQFLQVLFLLILQYVQGNVISCMQLFYTIEFDLWSYIVGHCFSSFLYSIWYLECSVIIAFGKYLFWYALLLLFPTFGCYRGIYFQVILCRCHIIMLFKMLYE